MKGRKRALAQMGGRVRCGGDPEVAAVLSRAWRRASEDDGDQVTHGFHTWPARMHFAIARTVLMAFDSATVLDPFSGGATVPIEAMLAGRRCIGVDLDPLAALLGDVKTQKRTPEEIGRFLGTASTVADASETRVRERVPIFADLPAEERQWYAPHVLKELGGLLAEIRAVEDRRDRRALGMVFSSIVVKVSKQRSDTSQEEAPTRIRKGLSTEIFLRKAQELGARWSELAEAAKGPAPTFHTGDARALRKVIGRRSVDLILTSPPYGGTYDYATHHARRAAWLGLNATGLKRSEIGARRRLSRRTGRETWDAEVAAMLASMADVLDREGRIVLVMGDGEVARRRVELMPQLGRLAPRAGLDLIASASQPRRNWGGSGDREEHLVVLARSR
ncbi:MAG: hypothetical protein AB8I08_03785 [Sandaracinaceae bacterium]